MNSFKGRGVVLNAMDVGESDKRLTLLLKEKGKIYVSARGARKPKSKFLAGTELFTYADFVLLDGGRFTVLSQVDVIESFYPIRQDYGALCAAAYFSELCHVFLPLDLPCDDILLFFLKTLSVLSKGRVNPGLLSCIFQLKLLQLNGFSPALSNCTHCGREVPLEKARRFCPAGVLCSVCKTTDAPTLLLPEEAVYALSVILDSPIDKTYGFEASRPVLEALKKAADFFVGQHLQGPLKSKKLLDGVFHQWLTTPTPQEKF